MPTRAAPVASAVSARSLPLSVSASAFLASLSEALPVLLAIAWPPFWARQARLGLPSVSREASSTPPSRLTFFRN